MKLQSECYLKWHDIFSCNGSTQGQKRRRTKNCLANHHRKYGNDAAKQGRTERILSWAPLAAAGPSMYGLGAQPYIQLESAVCWYLPSSSVLRLDQPNYYAYFYLKGKHLARAYETWQAVSYRYCYNFTKMFRTPMLSRDPKLTYDSDFLLKNGEHSTTLYQSCFLIIR